MSSPLRIRRNQKVRLEAISPEPPRAAQRDAIEAETATLGAELAELEDLLYFSGTHAMLIVLQGRDTAGKDGTIRKLLDYCNVQGARVESFKVPTALELAHDFLWRVHARVPGRGELVIFNRSHYEDVLVPRVHALVPKDVWKPRYRAIRHFEDLLEANRTIVLKFFLHISKDEQRTRLLDREQDREKAWKLAVGDWKEREHWDAYTEAYEEALSRCSTRGAPWYVVPANAKWYRNYLVVKTVVEHLRAYRREWLGDLERLGHARAAEIEAYRRAASGSRGKGSAAKAQSRGRGVTAPGASRGRRPAKPSSGRSPGERD